jgi:hypothetical protein
MNGWCALVAHASGHIEATATDGSAVVRFDSDGVVVDSAPLPVTARGRSSTTDHDAGRWFTSADGAVACYEGSQLRWRTAGAAVALCLAADRRRLYAASDAEVSEYDTATGSRRTLATIEEARLIALALAPGGLVGLDARQAALVGINVRHGTTTTIHIGEWANPAAVAYQRVGDCYVIAVADHPDLWLVSRDGSTARRLALRYA